MKKLFALFAGLFVAAVAVSAQPAFEFVELLSLANRPAALTTGWLVDDGDTTNYTTLGKVVDVSRSDKVAIAVGAALAGTGTDDTEIYFQKSADGIVWETTPSIALTNVNTGNTRKEGLHIVDVGGVKMIRLHSIKNNDAGDDLTNIVVSVGVKNR